MSQISAFKSTVKLNLNNNDIQLLKKFFSLVFLVISFLHIYLQNKVNQMLENALNTA